jgi:hypothetical protein
MLRREIFALDLGMPASFVINHPPALPGFLTPAMTAAAGMETTKTTAKTTVKTTGKTTVKTTDGDPD